MNEGIEINVTFPGDSDGFVGLLCGDCETVFKVHAVETSSSEVHFCPACGHELGQDRLTELQQDYVNDLVMREVKRKISDGFSASFSGSSGITFTPSAEDAPPEPPAEPDDQWPIMRFTDGTKAKLEQVVEGKQYFCPTTGQEEVPAKL